MTAVWSNLAPSWHALGDTWSGIFDRFVYQPNVRVFVNGVEVSDLLDGDVSVRRGRDTVYQPTNAGYASFEFVDLDQVPFRVGSPVRVTLDDFVGNPQIIFRGTVSDFERRLNVFSLSDPRVSVSVQAVGPLARAHRRVVLFGGRGVENDGERVAAALEPAISERWDEQPFEESWAQVDNGATWESFDGFDPSLIDDGLFDLRALDADDAGYDPLGVVQEAAFSSQGILFETPDGRIGYANGDRRFQNLRENVVDIPLSVTTFNGFAVASQFADVTNVVTVVYGADDAVTDTEPLSLSIFGRAEQQVATALNDEENAEDFAEEFLARHSFPQLRLQEIGIGVEVVDGLLLQDLFRLGSCGCSDAVRLNGIPPRLGIDRFTGFVEGIEWRLGRSTAELRLLVSDAQLSVGSVRWSAVDPTLQWDGVSATLEWRDARAVTT